jgi:hypothetical protein
LIIVVFDIQGLSNGYFVNEYVFHNTGMKERHTTMVVVSRDRLLVSLKLTTTVDWKRSIELQYHSEQNRVFLFNRYWYDTTNRGIRVDPHYDLVEINSKTRHCNINDVFVFAKQS